MTYIEQKEQIKNDYSNFIKKIKDEYIGTIDSSNDTKNKEIEEINSLINFLQSETANIELFLAHDNIIEKYYGESRELKILRLFQQKNILNNPSAVEIYEKYKETLSIDKLQNKIQEMKDEIEEKNSKIQQVEPLITGQDFDRELIDKLCEELNIDSKTKIKILLYTIISKVEEKSKKVILPQEEPIDEMNNEENVTLTELQENLEPAEENIEINHNDDDKEQLEQLKNDLISCKENYETLIKANQPVYEKYFALSNNQHEIQYTVSESPKEELLKKIADTMVKIRKIRKDIDKQLKIITTSKSFNEDDIGLINLSLEDLKISFGLLQTLDRSIRSMEEINSIVQKVYMLHSEKDVFIDSKILKDRNLSSNLYRLIEKGEQGEIQARNELKLGIIDPDKLDSKQSYLVALNDLNVKNIQTVRTNNEKILMSYIILNNKNKNSVEDNYIYILTVAENFDDLSNNTRKIVENEAIRQLIKKQMKDIDELNSEEIQAQVEIMNKLRENSSQSDDEKSSKPRKKI